ncbi:MAG TPA: hypothetical protein VIY71_08360 [Solirubrobacterales bacterium]
MGARIGGVGIKLGAGRRVRLLVPALACFALLAFAPPASATFHEISIREVYPGGANEASYVELQMWAAGQNFVGGRHLVAYNANGSVNENFTLPGQVASGANQATILVADTSYSVVFGGKPAPDASDASLNLSPAGGAVCWIEGTPPDCVAWGNFTGPLPSHLPELKVGSPASPAGATPGKALRRSIAAGCSTLLDAPPTDDSDNSDGDFSEQDPDPRNNATAPTEKVCSLPNTTIETLPTNPSDPTKSTSASFSFTANPPAGASFECRRDGEPAFAPCTSPRAYTELGEGNRVFEVRAVNPTGADPSPATYKWRIDLTAPTATILTEPADPSPGNSAAFTYSSSETGSTFQCSLRRTGEADDFSACQATGKTYPDAGHPGPLTNGDWTFKVLATDKAGNEGSADETSWTVDNTLTDETPPETTIDSKPPDPSSSSSAAFTYSSNEPGSSFQCQFDGAGFSACPAGGVSYSGLSNGPHTFLVRAIDPSNNADLSPAGYSFSVVLGGAPPVVSLPPSTPSLVPALKPKTTISGKPGARTRDRTPTFRFGSNSPGATFQCKLDNGPFKACRSPLTTKPLPYGNHLLRVRAILGGTPDPSPARSAFKVLRP